MSDITNDGKFVFIRSYVVTEALRQTNRQYFVGNLAKPQELPFIRDEQLEVGITCYDSGTVESPHWHLSQREYMYVVSGDITYREVATGAEHQYHKGDFFGILPQLCYTQESAKGTTVIFIKHPAINDKVNCRTCSKDGCPGRIEPFAKEEHST